MEDNSIVYIAWFLAFEDTEEFCRWKSLLQENL